MMELLSPGEFIGLVEKVMDLIFPLEKELSLSGRAEALIHIAHAQFREKAFF